jgi:hypothetical protein
MIINRKERGVEKPITKSLNATQEKKIFDLYAQGKGALEIKHEIYADFEKGKSFHHLIGPAIDKIEAVQSACDAAMSSDSKPKTVAALKTKVKAEVSGDAAIIDYATSKVVAKTGTFKDYGDTFVAAKATKAIN